MPHFVDGKKESQAYHLPLQESCAYTAHAAHFTLPFADQYETWGNRLPGKEEIKRKDSLAALKGSLPGTGVGEEKVEELVPANPQHMAAYSCLLPWA